MAIRRKNPIILFVLSILSCCFFVLHAQNITISPSPINDQLPSTTVQRLFQDKAGFIWFGTPNGLCRYDGYRIIELRSKLEKDDSLESNEITCFTEDNNNHLWIGTKAGIDIIDQKNYQRISFSDERVNNMVIKCLITTSDGFVWVGANDRLLKYDSNLNFIRDYDTVLPIYSISLLYEDMDNNLWVTLWRKGLFRYDAKKDTFIEYPTIGNANNPFKIIQDKEKRYWVCTWGEGVYFFKPDMKNPDKSVYIHQEIKHLNSSVKEEVFFSATQDDRYGYLWFVSISGVYACKYKKENELEAVDLSHLFKESNNIFSEIIKDSSGNLWIGTFGEGVLNVNFDMPVIRNYTLSSIKQKTGITPNITALFVDREGIIWANQNRKGLTILNTQNGAVTFYEDMEALKDVEVMNVTSCISGLSRQSDIIWIGPENEPSIYVIKKDKACISVERKIELSESTTDPGNPRKFYEDAGNNMWIITTNKLFIKPANEETIKYIDYDFGVVSDITNDPDGNIWLSTRNKGIYKINLNEQLTIQSGQIKNYSKNTGHLTPNNTEAIASDTTGKIWIGTRSGNLASYDIKENKFEKTNEITVYPNEILLNMLIDNYGHIWISTNKRITEYNPGNNASRYYSQSDGVSVNSFSQGACFKDKSGKLYFGGNKGISVFESSNKLSETPLKKKTYLTDVKINNKSVFQGCNNQFDMVEQSIILNSGDKNIEFNFSSLDYAYSSKIRYAYKMEGVDDDWIYTEEKYQFAIYNQLKKGNYTLLIKSTNENKLWSDEISGIKIYKRPAYYETVWAYLIYSTLLLVLIRFIYTIIKNRIRLRNNLKIAQIEKEKSEELTQMKLRYFTNISHDFLTPLTIISCLIDDAEITNKDKITQFDSIRSNIGRLKRLLQQILDFRKIESGNMKLNISKGDIAGLIQELCLSSFLPLMRKKNINFTFNTAPSHIDAYFDPDKVDKIIYNLLSNACKYTPPNGNVNLCLKESTEGNTHFLTIKVSDTGVGISREDLSNIFTRFYSNSINKSGESNGIGLNLTKDLVEIHKGTIHAESEIDKGSVFTVTIPIDKDSYNDNDASLVDSIIIQGRSMATTGSKTDVTILLVEDNKELLELMMNILSKHYNILAAKNGIEALNCVKENKTDIIISDVMMPEMDGLELCREIKKDLKTSHIPIILLTAKNNTQDRIDCYNAGADGYITKPFDLKVLEARINNFIATKKVQQKEFKSDVNINLSTLNFPSIDEQFLTNAIKIIENNLLEPDFDVITLSEKLNMSKSSLYRKLKGMTDLSPSDFIRNIRLKQACLLLKNKTITISEIAYAVGFSDPKYFSLCFKNEFNMTPSEFQKGRH
ncbi:MAG: response regulator [Tannerellaceae bacterium]|jgi:signal transduction histidine kinase/ligand-binding sensor domain-containing protein/AraC-like DNA-binding protein|nr:response regulator [Tannerellaceae bacterium]